MHAYTIGLNSQTLRHQALRPFVSQALRVSDSQTLRLPVSQALRFSDSQILRLRHFRSTHTYTIGLDSQTLWLSGSQSLRFLKSQAVRSSPDCQTPRLHKHAYVHNRIGLSNSQAVRVSDCQLVPESHRIAKIRKLSNCPFLRTSEYQTLRFSDTQTLRLSESKI